MSSPIQSPSEEHSSQTDYIYGGHISNDKNVLSRDPRRLTPNLHASLVSEILTLRRDVESKRDDIEHLEEALHAARDESESFQASLAATTKETRSLRHQLQLLEGGSSSAVIELSKERDAALIEVQELKQRQELSQRKTRSQEELAQKTQMLWDRDRDTWHKEKRALETKIHIVEGRLKVISSEIANSHLAGKHYQQPDEQGSGSPKRMLMRKSSAASLRSLNIASRRRDSEISSGTQEGEAHGYRLSTATLGNGLAASLAEELALNEEEEDQLDEDAADEEDEEEQYSSDEMPDGRSMSAQSRPLDFKARKILGLSLDDPLPGSSSHSPSQSKGSDSLPKVNELIRTEFSCRPQYVDAGVQYETPYVPSHLNTAEALSWEETEMNAHRTFSISDTPLTSGKAERPMISTSCQTTSQLPTPPRTPLGVLDCPAKHLSGLLVRQADMVATAMQTEPLETVDLVALERDNTQASSQFHVPIIAIHPPLSRPATPTGSVVLPPRTKSVGCQAGTADRVITTASAAVQTAEPHKYDDLSSRLLNQPRQTDFAGRRVDKSLGQKPPHEFGKTLPAVPTKRRVNESKADRSIASNKRAEDLEAYKGMLTSDFPQGASRADVRSAPSEEMAESDGSLSPPDGGAQLDACPTSSRDDQDDIFNRPMAKFTLKGGKVVSHGKKRLDLDQIFDDLDAEADTSDMRSNDNFPAKLFGLSSRYGKRDGLLKARALEFKPKALKSASSRPVDIRKAALISSGTVAHQLSSLQDPATDLPTTQVNPPFPVPTRHSSRKVPISASEGAHSPTPEGRSPRRRGDRGRRPVLRNVRSATNVHGARAVDAGRNEHPIMPAPHSYRRNNGSPALASLLCGDASMPSGLAMVNSSGTPSPAFQDRPPSSSESTVTGAQSNTVVDAIAHTSVGEWMFKYVRRRRKSFGVSEPRVQDWDLPRNGDELSATITKTGQRHKRWVWLAPYERAVMWSSKAPTSESALMGKHVRKCKHQYFLSPLFGVILLI